MRRNQARRSLALELAPALIVAAALVVSFAHEGQARGARIPAPAQPPVAVSFDLVGALLSAAPRSPARTASGPTHIPTTTYASNTTWTLPGSPYVLDGNVTVATGAILTVEPGVVVKLNGQFRTLTVNGTLSALGTAASRISFTSYQDDTVGGDSNGDGQASSPAPGQWYQLQFNSNTSQLAYVDVRYGGYGSAQNYAPIVVYGSGKALTIDHA